MDAYRSEEVWHRIVLGVLLISTAETTTTSDLQGCASRDLIVSENRESQRNVSDFKTEDAMEFLTDLIGGLAWTHVTLLSDQEDISAQLFQHLQGWSVLAEVHYVNTTVLGQRSDSLIHVLGPPVHGDNILLVGTPRFQREMFRQMEALSNETGLSRYVIDTSWLLLASSDVINDINTTSFTLNNLVVVTYDQRGPMQVKTLLRKAEGHVLSDVTKHNVITWGMAVTSAQLYPNKRKGLNGRHIRVGINVKKVETTSDFLCLHLVGKLIVLLLHILFSLAIAAVFVGILTDISAAQLPSLWYFYTSAVDQGNGSITYIGLCMDLLNIGAQELNFSYSLVLPSDGRWGAKRDGHWTGLLGLIERQEVDLVAAPLTPFVERKEVSDWLTTPFDYFYIGIVVADTQHSQLHMWSAYLNFFRWQVYACICGSFLLAVFCMKALLLWEHCLHHTTRCYCLVSHMDIAQYLLGAILNKAVVVQETWNQGPSSRLFMACWCLLGLLLTSCYTCQLTSLLVAAPSPLPFTSFADMAKRDDIRWGTIDGTVVTQDFRESDNEVKQTIYQKMMMFAEEDPSVISQDPEIHLQKVLSGGYAYFGDGKTLELWASRHCQLMVIPDDIFGGAENCNFFTPKNSPLLEKMDRLLLRLEDTGILTYLRQKWFPRLETCHDSNASPQTITMVTLQGPCYVAVAALLLATGILLCEWYFRPRC